MEVREVGFAKPHAPDGRNVKFRPYNVRSEVRHMELLYKPNADEALQRW